MHSQDQITAKFSLVRKDQKKCGKESDKALLNNKLYRIGKNLQVMSLRHLTLLKLIILKIHSKIVIF